MAEHILNTPTTAPRAASETQDNCLGCSPSALYEACCEKRAEAARTWATSHMGALSSQPPAATARCIKWQWSPHPPETKPHPIAVYAAAAPVGGCTPCREHLWHLPPKIGMRFPSAAGGGLARPTCPRLTVFGDLFAQAIRTPDGEILQLLHGAMDQIGFDLCAPTAAASEVPSSNAAAACHAEWAHCGDARKLI